MYLNIIDGKHIYIDTWLLQQENRVYQEIHNFRRNSNTNKPQKLDGENVYRIEMTFNIIATPANPMRVLEHPALHPPSKNNWENASVPARNRKRRRQLDRHFWCLETNITGGVIMSNFCCSRSILIGLAKAIEKKKR